MPDKRSYDGKKEMTTLYGTKWCSHASTDTPRDQTARKTQSFKRLISPVACVTQLVGRCSVQGCWFDSHTPGCNLDPS